MTFIDNEDGAWGSYNPTVEAARREAFDLRGEVRALKKERDGLLADAEVEVLAKVVSAYSGDPDSRGNKAVKSVNLDVVPVGTELVDRIHVVRLTAERDGLKAEIKRLKEVALIFIDEIQARDTELLKARELLKQAAATCHPKMSDKIEEFLQ